MFSPLLLKLIGIAVLLISVFVAGYNTAHKFDTAALAKAQALAEAKYTAKDQAYNQIANDYEKTKVNSQKAVAVRNRIVTKIIKAPIYSNVCLDSDGLSVANSALTRQPTTTSQPDATLPPPVTAK